MGLIIAALHLPYTVQFGQRASPELENDQPSEPAHQFAKSIVRGQAEEEEANARLRAEVPFDFADNSKSWLQPQPRVSDSAIPQRSIVDQRKPVDTKAPIAVNVKTKRRSMLDSEPPSRGRTPARTPSPVRSPQASGSPGRLRLFSRRRYSVTPASQFAYHSWDIVIQTGSNRGMYNAVDCCVAQGNLEAPKCVGLLGMPTDALPDIFKAQISRQMQETRRCYPVYVTDIQVQGHYDIYCKQFLWPTFHCQIPDIPTSKAYEDYSWGDYTAVNRAIADQVVAAYQPGDLIWVHDYHLMLVPQMIREKLPNAAIGFFMHVAFPTSEVFRCLAYRAPLLRGLLASNIVAFQISEYMKHLMMTSARILATDTGQGRIETSMHDVIVTSCPIGIDAPILDAIAREGSEGEAVTQHRNVIRKRWPTQKIIAARDKFDPVRGLSQKLRGFEMFLSQNPQYATSVVLIQICAATSDLEDSDLSALADHINSKYGDLAAGIHPVVLLRQDVRFEQYLALLAEADGFVVTCLREGMNLTCHEYVHMNERCGPLILSEFTGSASVFGDDALLVNPWNIKQLALSFKEAVEMSPCERETRHAALSRKVTEHTGSQWVNTMVGSINNSWLEDMARACTKPDIPELQRIYRNKGPRLFLLELDFPQQHSDSYFVERLPRVLSGLAQDSRNIVYAMTAESPRNMDRLYRQLPDVGLIAESGRYVRPPSGEWRDLGATGHEPSGDSWHNDIAPIIMRMQERDLVKSVAIHESSIVVDLLPPEGESEIRDLSVFGEYTSVINDTFAPSGVHCKLDNSQIVIYTDHLGGIRLRAYRHVLESTDIIGPLSMLMVANQAYTNVADDPVYSWAEHQKETGRTKDLVTVVLGKHSAYARCMVEGVNALLSLLQAMRSSS